MTVHQLGTAPPAKPVRRGVAMITGGAGGIGREIGAELAQAGYALCVADVDTQQAAAAATDLTRHGTDVIWVDANVTEQSSVTRAVNETVQRLGQIDVLVNCAGWNAPAPLAATDETHWRRMLDVNLTGVIRVTHAVLPMMVERRSGRIINIAGEAGRVGTAEQSLMSAAHGGVIAFTKAIAREVASTGVTVNCVAPGSIATPMLDHLIAQAEDATGLMGALRAAVPMGRLGQPQDVAPAVLFLASDGAAYITGQTLSVSGGQTMS